VKNTVAKREAIRKNGEKNVVVDGVESGTKAKQDESRFFTAVDRVDRVVME
jgi:hypothetical protein